MPEILKDHRDTMTTGEVLAQLARLPKDIPVFIDTGYWDDAESRDLSVDPISYIFITTRGGDVPEDLVSWEGMTPATDVEGVVAVKLA